MQQRGLISQAIREIVLFSTVFVGSLGLLHFVEFPIQFFGAADPTPASVVSLKCGELFGAELCVRC